MIHTVSSSALIKQDPDADIKKSMEEFAQFSKKKIAVRMKYRKPVKLTLYKRV